MRLIDCVRFLLILGISSSVLCRHHEILTIPGKFCKIKKGHHLPTTVLSSKFIENNCEFNTKFKEVEIVESVKGLDENLFQHLDKVEVFKASNINLTAVSLTTYNLKFIDFSMNNLTDFYVDIRNELVALNVSCNNLEDFRFGSNNAFPIFGLVSLDLSHNKISSFDFTFSLAFANLMFLNLSHNLIETLPASLRKFPSLLELSLAYNKLHKLEPMNNLDMLKNLRNLNFDGNVLKSFDCNELLIVLPNLEKLGIQNNPLQCSWLIKLVDSIRLRATELTKDEMCTSKTEYQGFCCETNMNLTTTHKIRHKNITELQAFMHFIGKIYRDNIDGIERLFNTTFSSKKTTKDKVTAIGSSKFVIFFSIMTASFFIYKFINNMRGRYLRNLYGRRNIYRLENLDLEE